jgi:hypothetical protein
MTCDSVFVPRGAKISHGSYRGYNRHSSKRTGQWAWPPCPSCRQAALEWRRENEAKPDVRKTRRRRNAARSEALARLRRQYPGAYAAAYLEELHLRGGEGSRQKFQVPVWDGIIARLVKAATGDDEERVATRIRQGIASPAEIEVARQVGRLRALVVSLTRESTESSHDI